MGLDERRGLKAIQEDMVPKVKASIKEISGADIAVELEEAGFLDPETGKVGSDNVKAGFDETLTAIKAISADAMGKESLQKGLKKIVFKHLSADQMRNRSIAMNGGTLTVANYWGSGAYATAKEIQKLIESQI